MIVNIKSLTMLKFDLWKLIILFMILDFFTNCLFKLKLIIEIVIYQRISRWTTNT